MKETIKKYSFGKFKQSIHTFFKKGDLNIFLTLLCVHIFVGTVHLFVNYSRHPLMNLMETWPLFIQIMGVSLYGTMAYIIPGYLLVIAFKDKERLLKNVDFSLIVLTVIFLTVFIILYVMTQFKASPLIWKLYSFINPVLGTFSEKLMRARWTSIFWFVGAFIPSFGLLIGLYLRFRREGYVS